MKITLFYLNANFFSFRKSTQLLQVDFFLVIRYMFECTCYLIFWKLKRKFLKTSSAQNHWKERWSSTRIHHKVETAVYNAHLCEEPLIIHPKNICLHRRTSQKTHYVMLNKKSVIKMLAFSYKRFLLVLSSPCGMTSSVDSSSVCIGTTFIIMPCVSRFQIILIL